MTFDILDYLPWIIGICMFLLVIVVGYYIWYDSTRTCIQYEDMCYHRVTQLIPTGKTIVIVHHERPTDCGESDVIGHKQFCTRYDK